jgi:hypothetical protein
MWEMVDACRKKKKSAKALGHLVSLVCYSPPPQQMHDCRSSKHNFFIASNTQVLIFAMIPLTKMANVESRARLGGRANTHGKITTHKKVQLVKHVLLIFSCLSFAVGQRLSLERLKNRPVSGQATALQDEQLLVGRVSQQKGGGGQATSDLRRRATRGQSRLHPTIETQRWRKGRGGKNKGK